MGLAEDIRVAVLALKGVDGSRGNLTLIGRAYLCEGFPIPR
jgi:hypothetical protein